MAKITGICTFDSFIFDQKILASLKNARIFEKCEQFFKTWTLFQKVNSFLKFQTTFLKFWIFFWTFWIIDIKKIEDTKNICELKKSLFWKKFTNWKIVRVFQKNVCEFLKKHEIEKCSVNEIE